VNDENDALDPIELRKLFGERGLRDDAVAVGIFGVGARADFAPFQALSPLLCGSIALIAEDGSVIAEKAVFPVAIRRGGAVLRKLLRSTAEVGMKPREKLLLKALLPIALPFGAPLGALIRLLIQPITKHVTRITEKLGDGPAALVAAAATDILVTIPLAILLVPFLPAIPAIILLVRKRKGPTRIRFALPPISAHQRVELAGAIAAKGENA
jgi:hypothetical protein